MIGADASIPLRFLLNDDSAPVFPGQCGLRLMGLRHALCLPRQRLLLQTRSGGEVNSI